MKKVKLSYNFYKIENAHDLKDALLVKKDNTLGDPMIECGIFNGLEDIFKQHNSCDTLDAYRLFLKKRKNVDTNEQIYFIGNDTRYNFYSFNEIKDEFYIRKLEEAHDI